MNKKNTILALALSASFVVGGASVSQASEAPVADKLVSEEIKDQPTSPEATSTEASNPTKDQAPAEADHAPKEGESEGPEATSIEDSEENPDQEPANSGEDSEKNSEDQAKKGPAQDNKALLDEFSMEKMAQFAKGLEPDSLEVSADKESQPVRVQAANPGETTENTNAEGEDYQKSSVVEDEKHVTNNGEKEYRQSEIAGSGMKVTVNKDQLNE